MSNYTPEPDKADMPETEMTVPENNKLVLGWHKAINGNLIPCIVQYTEGWDIVVDDEDCDRDDINYDEVKDVCYLTNGWYECCEQSQGTYDEVWFKRNIVKWQPIERTAALELCNKELAERLSEAYAERDILKKLYTTLFEEHAWIPVTERVPDDDRRVLVCIGGKSQILPYDYNPKFGWSPYDSPMLNKNVTHWRDYEADPLPLPPTQA